MQKHRVGAFLFAAVIAGSACAQDEMTTATLKEKGAKQLAKADVDTLLRGSTVEVEGNLYFNRYNNKPDGSLDASGVPRMGGGASNRPWSAVGNWNITDQNQYCVDFKTMSGGGGKYCMFVWTLGSDYFVTYNRSEGAKAWGIKVSK